MQSLENSFTHIQIDIQGTLALAFYSNLPFSSRCRKLIFWLYGIIKFQIQLGSQNNTIVSQICSTKLLKMKFNILSVLQLSLMEYLNFYLAFERGRVVTYLQIKIISTVNVSNCYKFILQERSLYSSCYAGL